MDHATLHIKEAATPEIIVQPGPADITCFVDDELTIDLVAINATKYQWQYSKDGGATKYQWQCSTNGGVTWVNLTNGSFWKGNKTDTLTFTTMDRHNGYLFRCLAINDAGTTASAAAKLPGKYRGSTRSIRA